MLTQSLARPPCFVVAALLAMVNPTSAQEPTGTLSRDTAVSSTPAQAPMPGAPTQIAPDSPAALAVSSSISAGTELLIASAYVWRGFVPTDTVSYQPTSWAKYRELTVSSWFNVAGGQSVGPLTEHDLTVDWSRSTGAWTVSAGWINYVFPGASANQVSNEIYGGVALSAPLNPFVKVFQDVHAGTGTYVALGVSHSLTLPHDASVTPSFALGYNHEQWIDDSLWSDATVGLKLMLPTPVSRLWVSSFVNYTWGMSELFKDTLHGGIGIAVR